MTVKLVMVTAALLALAACVDDGPSPADNGGNYGPDIRHNRWHEQSHRGVSDARITVTAMAARAVHAD